MYFFWIWLSWVIMHNKSFRRVTLFYAKLKTPLYIWLFICRNRKIKTTLFYKKINAKNKINKKHRKQHNFYEKISREQLSKTLFVIKLFCFFFFVLIKNLLILEILYGALFYRVKWLW